jgi:sugar (pentulose or hexulose) kinase
MGTKNVIVCDIGGSSARVFKAGYDGSKLSLNVLHRFSNKPVSMGKSLYWDIFGLYDGLKQGITAAGSDAVSIGIDSMCNDYMLFDQADNMIEPPHTYRDARTVGMVEEMDRFISKKDLYYRTGLQFNRMNSLYQWLSIVRDRLQVLEAAKSLLFIPDALMFFLSGEKATEYTLASVSQGYSPIEGAWDIPLLNKIGFPARLLQRIIDPATLIGSLSRSVCEELSVNTIQVIAVGGHDTASAVAAVPSLEPKFAYISSGTWSIVGTELESPLINERSYRHSLANEGGVGGRIRLLKNVMGLWILQECRRFWHERGLSISFSSLVELAVKSDWEQHLFDPDDELFYQPGPMPELITQYFTTLGKTPPREVGDIVRCVLLSLACKYRYVLECLEYACGYRFSSINIVGGGAENALLNQFTANITGKPVIAGPSEATALGNAIVQLIALGEFHSLSEGRSAVINSVDLKLFQPDSNGRWQDIYVRFIAEAGLLSVES